MPHPGSAPSLRVRAATQELVRLGQKEPPLDSNLPVAALLSLVKSWRTAVHSSVADPKLVECLLVVLQLVRELAVEIQHQKNLRG